MKVRNLLLGTILMLFILISCDVPTSSSGEITPGTPSIIAVTDLDAQGSQTVIIAESGTYQLGVSIVPSNATDQLVNWQSVNDSVASVSSGGLVTGEAVGGPVNITAKSNDGNFDVTFSVTVSSTYTAVTSIAYASPLSDLAVGDTFDINPVVLPAGASNPAANFSSSDSSVAAVDSDGVVTAAGTGTTTITISHPDLTSAEDIVKDVTVFKPLTSISQVSDVELYYYPAGSFYESESLDIVLDPVDASDPDITSVSSDPAIASVSSDGTVTAVSEGAVTITTTSTTYSSVTPAITTVTVHEYKPVTSVSLPAALEMEISDTNSLSAVILPSDATYQSGSYDSSAPVIVEVDDSGNLTALAAGTATITFTSDDDHMGAPETAATLVTVTAPEVFPTELKIFTVVDLSSGSYSDVDAATISNGSQAAFSAVLFPSETTDQSVTFVSSNSSVINIISTETGIDPLTGSYYTAVLVAALADGASIISATSDADGSVSDSVAVTVVTLPGPVFEDWSTPSLTTVELNFDKALDSVTAEDVNNYSILEWDDVNSIDIPLSISSAQLLSSGDSVLLTLVTPFEYGEHYDLSISGVKDLAGNLMTSVPFEDLFFSIDIAPINAGFVSRDAGTGFVTATAGAVDLTADYTGGQFTHVVIIVPVGEDILVDVESVPMDTNILGTSVVNNADGSFTSLGDFWQFFATRAGTPVNLPTGSYDFYILLLADPDSGDADMDFIDDAMISSSEAVTITF